MSVIGKLGREIVARFRNKITPEAINQRNTQKTLDTLSFTQEVPDSFERILSDDTLVDASLEYHAELNENCAEFVDEYWYEDYSSEQQTQTIPKEVLNIIA